MHGFKAHIVKKYQRFQQELSAELRMMVRAKGGSIKTDCISIENEYLYHYTEIALNEDNDVIFKTSSREHKLEDMNLDIVFKIIATIK